MQIILDLLTIAGILAGLAICLFLASIPASIISVAIASALGGI